MENEKTPLYVAFSTQKGGVGKTTFTVLAASYLYYLKGYDVVVVDCDYPQHSIAGMRKRDAEMVGEDEDYKRMAYEQFTRLGKKAYPVLCSSPEKAIATADEYITAAANVPDIVFFDLPGTVNSEGVINSLSGMDYIFTPIAADKVVLESSLSFAVELLPICPALILIYWQLHVRNFHYLLLPVLGMNAMIQCLIPWLIPG